MLTRIVLLTSVLALTVGGLTPAFAGGSTVHVEQHGWWNGFGGSQHGYKNRLTVYQDGKSNHIISTQDAARTAR